MCGILGHINLKNTIDPTVFEKMCQSLRHRGPDDMGVEIQDNIALGHTRLSFLDLSAKGKQPFLNSQKNILLTFNGEIYNFIELKEQLKNEYTFTTESDTEVILAAYENWGINCVNHLKGMFAFAIWDKEKNKLFLVRDRFGIKPLYYYQDDNKLIFASEIKAILASGLVEKQINYSSFCDYFVYRYIPSPKTIWKNIHKVPPAHYLSIDVNTLAIDKQEYWTLTANNNKADEKELINEINTILSKSVEIHTRADVPVGSFLSGGYDSSAMVHYMHKHKYKDIQTFSIGFDKWERSEHSFARQVADTYKAKNKAIIADNKSLDHIEKMPMVYDEPIADISIIPTYMVSQLARKDVKAVLSGEGADELFGGYTWQQDFYKQNYPEHWLERIKLLFKEKDTVQFYAQAMAMGWFDADELKKMLHPDLYKHIPEDVHWFYRKHFKENLTPLKSIQYMDMKCFMGELVLTKVDRASMANSLEVRVPFLDHTLFEKIFSVDEKKYYKKDKTKYLLYENLKDSLPQEILDRKKQGFVGPDSYYMNKEWYREQLKDSKLVENKIIKREYIDNLLAKDYDWRIWKILVMEKWFARWNA